MAVGRNTPCNKPGQVRRKSVSKDGKTTFRCVNPTSSPSWKKPVMLPNGHFAKRLPRMAPATKNTPCRDPTYKRVQAVSNKTGRTTFVCRPKPQKQIWAERVAVKQCPQGKVVTVNSAGALICMSKKKTHGLVRDGGYRVHVPHSGLKKYANYPLGARGTKANVTSGRAHHTATGLTIKDFTRLDNGRWVYTSRHLAAKAKYDRYGLPARMLAKQFKKEVPIIPTTDLNNMATTSLEAVANTGTRPTAASKRAVRVQRVGTRRSARLR